MREERQGEEIDRNVRQACVCGGVGSRREKQERGKKYGEERQRCACHRTAEVFSSTPAPRESLTSVIQTLF